MVVMRVVVLVVLVREAEHVEDDGDGKQEEGVPDHHVPDCVKHLDPVCGGRGR
jgi:hypothetical protein